MGGNILLSKRISNRDYESVDSIGIGLAKLLSVGDKIESRKNSLFGIGGDYCLEHNFYWEQGRW